jgi:anti-sigma factor RsiW
MKCQQCENSLSDYADGTLSAKRQAAVQAHLSCCEACRRQLEELLALKRLLGGACTPEPRPDFLNTAISRVAAAAERRRRVVRTVLRLQMAGVAIAAAVIGFAVLRVPTDTPAPQSDATVNPEATFDPAALVSMHASLRATRPLADTGKVRFAISEGNARDYANDTAFDAQ